MAKESSEVEMAAQTEGSLGSLQPGYHLGSCVHTLHESCCICFQDAEPLTLITRVQEVDPDFQLNGIVVYTFENLILRPRDYFKSTVRVVKFGSALEWREDWIEKQSHLMI